MSDLKGKVIVITGASSGIGAACGIEFAKYGTKLVLTGRNKQSLAEVAQQCLDNGAAQVHQVVGDLTIEDDVKSVATQTLDIFGTVDVLVNNAGAVSAQSSAKLVGKKDVGRPLTLTGDPADMDFQYKLTVRAPWQLAGMFVDQLIKNKGCIINMSAGFAIIPFPGDYAYSTMKAAMNYMTKCMATELGMRGVRVNCIMPAATRTRFFRDVVSDKGLDSFWQQVANSAHVLEQKIIEPVDVAQSVIFLASQAASKITGVLLPVDCGALLASPAYDFTGGQTDKN